MLPDRLKLRFIRRLELVGLAIVLLAACGRQNNNAPADVVSAPTRTLSPPTATFTPGALALTPTPTDLPSAAALGAGPISAPPAEPPAALPAAAQTMIERTMRDLIAQADIDPADIRLLSLEKFTWRDEAWGCSARAAEGYTHRTYRPGYRIIFSTGRRTYVYHTDRHATFFICEDTAWLALEGEPLPLDPIAQSMVELSTREALKQLDTADIELELVSLLLVDWPDASIGCPKPNADYGDELTPGYRIVFRAGDETLLYHTSIRHVVRCTPDEEILPGLLRRALPEPDETAS